MALINTSTKSVKQTSDENEEKYQLGHYEVIQYQALRSKIMRIVLPTVGSEMVKNFCYPTRLARRDVIQFSVRLKNKSVALLSPSFPEYAILTSF